MTEDRKARKAVRKARGRKAVVDLPFPSPKELMDQFMRLDHLNDDQLVEEMVDWLDDRLSYEFGKSAFANAAEGILESLDGHVVRALIRSMIYIHKGIDELPD